LRPRPRDFVCSRCARPRRTATQRCQLRRNYPLRGFDANGGTHECNGVAQVSQALDESVFLLLLGSSIEVICAELLVEGSVLEHVIDGREDRRRDGQDGLLGTAPCSDAVELGLEVGFASPPRAHCTSVVLSQGEPLRMRVDRRLPALSSLRGQMQAQETKW